MNSSTQQTEPDTNQQFDQFASGYDRFLWPLEKLVFGRERAAGFIASASGDVLELAVGTGANLHLYPPGVCAIGLDNSSKMLKVARQRAGNCMRLLRADAAQLPFPDARFDTVISTLLYCSLDDPAGTLAEIRRVLRPGGRLMMMEHVRGAPPAMDIVTDLLNVPWHALSRSCRLNRTPAEDLVPAGFTILSEQRHTLTIMQTIIATPA